MFDFHINIDSTALSPARAVLLAKAAGLRAFSLIYSLDSIPNFVSDTDLLYQEEALNLSQKNAYLVKDNPELQRIFELKKQIDCLSIYYDVQVYFGIKLSYLPPALLEEAILQCRFINVAQVGVLGESISDLVEHGTNFAACLAGADILYHPGLIDAEAVQVAAEKNCYLEITSHPQHAYCNAHVANMAKKHNAKLIFGSNAQKAEHIYSPEKQKLVCQGACINMHDIHNAEFLHHLQKKSFL